MPKNKTLKNKLTKKVVFVAAAIIIVTGFVFLFVKINKFLVPQAQIEELKELPYH